MSATTPGTKEYSANKVSAAGILIKSLKCTEEAFCPDVFFFILESPTTEALLRGREGIKYDLNHIGGEPIITSSDKISLYFKTRKSAGLLFYNGEID